MDNRHDDFYNSDAGEDFDQHFGNETAHGQSMSFHDTILGDSHNQIPQQAAPKKAPPKPIKKGKKW